MNSKIAIAYIPVLHKGYFDFVRQLEADGVEELWLVGDEILETHEELDYINRKDRLRAVPLPELMSALQVITILTLKELTPATAATITADTIVTPREDIGRVVVEHYFNEKNIEYVDVFLRRNQDNVGEEKIPETAVIPQSDFENGVWAEVLIEAKKSADWWRQVGAALVKDGQVIYVTHNEHMPEEQLPNIEGDARSLFKRGIHINYVTAAHAEVAAIGRAAKEGMVTEGAELFLTDSPCPYCARLIAKSGIKKVYFLKGYAVLDGDDFLKEENIEVVQVKLEE